LFGLWKRTQTPIRIKRAYEEAAHEDGERILVDRLWPRGLKKEEARVSEWIKNVAPSTELRKWFDHKPQNWNGRETQQRCVSQGIC